MILLAMAAIVLAGVAGCTGGELVEEQHENDKTVTLTTTVGLSASTKALTPAGVKTFAAGDKGGIAFAAIRYRIVRSGLVVALRLLLPRRDEHPLPSAPKN